MKQCGEIGNDFQDQIQRELQTLMKKRRNHAKPQSRFTDIVYKFFAALRETFFSNENTELSDVIFSCRIALFQIRTEVMQNAGIQNE
tara:strand:- start:42 stop:302 length:261 start_codon:yes stop_codon:yes gene_type:complete